MSEAYRSNRYFRALSDAELIAWRPYEGYGPWGARHMADCANISRCNREVRRRAAVTGCDGPYHWIGAVALREAFQSRHPTLPTEIEGLGV